MTKRRPAAQTALGPMVIAAVEQLLPAERRVIDDDLAQGFLPPGTRLVVRACKWRVIRDLVIGATDKQAHGLWASMLCRKRYADDKVAEALGDGIEQVVILGAGLDTRAYRLVVPAGARAFEVDLPENIEDKRARLGSVPDGVALIAVDFQRDDLGASLAAAGFRLDEPAMFVWEAVTQYLSQDAVRATLAFLGRAAPGSRLIFTFVRQDFLDGTDFYGAKGAHRQFVTRRRVWHFGLAPGAVRDLLAEYGWAEREQVGPEEYRARYLVPAGRDLPVSQIERFVYAAKP
ncbi:SAM-dependent methyltransferase [Nonomuraea sp. NPDC050790]|uniref:SAM-dependent methyltransferase n=1 Tax=Nonomuraea sp. NPDC050790 TaxID=3364371 RepID=UPI0037A6B28B